MSNLEIKHKEPELRQMLAEYGRMFSRKWLTFYLGWLGLLAVLLVIFRYGPSSLSESTNIVLRIVAFLDAYFLFGFGALLAFALLAPFFARVILPCAIMALEVVRLLLFAVQYLIDELLICPTTKCFLYAPKAEDEDLSHDA